MPKSSQLRAMRAATSPRLATKRRWKVGVLSTEGEAITPPRGTPLRGREPRSRPGESLAEALERTALGGAIGLRFPALDLGQGQRSIRARDEVGRVLSVGGARRHGDQVLE